jgi:hypothetical protein
LELADRDRREALRDQQSLTAAFFGDPLPGMSALDRRERERPRVKFDDELVPVRPASLVVEPGGTSVSTHGLGYLFTALRRQGLIADEFGLQLTTFLRSLDLFLELIVLTTSTLTANQVRHGGKQGTHNPELSCIHSSLPSIDFTPAEPPA